MPDIAKEMRTETMAKGKRALERLEEGLLEPLAGFARGVI
jgi:hypothetical protein